MNPPNSQTIEQALFDRMGISLEEALATGTDVLDEKVAAAAQRGVDVESRAEGMAQLLEKLSQPETINSALQLLDLLPRLVPIIRTLEQLPDILATVMDVLEDYQQQFADQGVDVEAALSNGLKSALWLGNQVDSEHLKRMGELLSSEILNADALHVIDSAARSLSSTQSDICEERSPNRIGMMGLWAALRRPEIQRSLAFAVRFGECFGKNLDAQQDESSG